MKVSRKIVIWAITAAVAITATVTVAGWLSTGADPDHLASWLEAAATTGALIAASIAAVYAAGAFRLESERDDRWVDSQKRGQAEQVAVWRYHISDVVVRNASAAPIYDVVIGIHVPNAPVFPIEAPVGTIPPSSDPQTVYLETEDLTAWRDHDYTDDGISIWFTDTASIRWERSRKGILTSHGLVVDPEDEVDPVERYGIPDDD